MAFIAGRIAGPNEASTVAREAEEWILKHLGRDYPWPGNVRELEQCVRNIMIRGEYLLPRRPPLADTDALATEIATGTLTADELLRRYCTLVYEQTGSYQETARRLQLDWRTVRDKIGAAVPDSEQNRPGRRGSG